MDRTKALSTALSGTIGMGNVSGVAVALAMGGPGAIFWMWVSALFGVATKFLHVHYPLCIGAMTQRVNFRVDLCTLSWKDWAKTGKHWPCFFHCLV